MKKITILLFLVPFFIFGQTHSIDNKNLEATGQPSNFDITKNTFYNAFDTCAISWLIINDSVPPQWDISFCFPTCFPIGVMSGQNTFMPSDKVFINGHFYPNSFAGEGFMQMEITTNLTQRDTITWYGVASEISNVESMFYSENMNIIKIYDINGRIVNQLQKGKTFIVRTNKNTFKTIYVL